MPQWGREPGPRSHDALSTENHRLFVYGTLRRGERAHALLAHSIPLGVVRTAAAYELRSLGPFPTLLPTGQSAVVGELYSVSSDLLDRLDRYEGEDYSRGTVRLEDGSTAVAYFAAPTVRDLGTIIESGDWLARRR